MKYTLLLFLSLFISCKNSRQDNTTHLTSKAGIDLFPDKVEVKYAKNFSVEYREHYKVVRTSATLGDWGTPGGETEDVKDVMVLVQRGWPAPELTGDLQNASVITVPATERIASNASNVELWIDMLGLIKKQVILGGTKTYNDSLRQLVENKTLGQVGYSWAAPPDMEILLDRNPEIFLMVISRVGFNTSLEKIRKFGIQTAPVFDWAERDYLATAEWIKYCALFFNEEKKANEAFDEIERNVTDLKKLVADKEKPTVLWAHFVDKGFWLAQSNNAEARLLKDAGVLSITEDFTKPFSPVGEAFTNEQLLVLGQQADHWIIGNGLRTSLPNESYLSGFKAWRSGKLYHHYKRSKPEHSTYDWFNLWPVRPDIALADLVQLFHPELMQNRETVFFDPYVKDRK
jgi:iron complex transport system substrate-binding protein